MTHLPYTPGPWMWSGGELWCPDAMVIHAPDTQILATIDVPNGFDEHGMAKPFGDLLTAAQANANVCANARLMAHADQMYELLKEMYGNPDAVPHWANIRTLLAAIEDTSEEITA